MEDAKRNQGGLLPKESLGLAAEYAVASELCRRGVYAQLTLGNRKRTDLLVDVEKGKMLRIQVKAKQGREWPACKGVYGPALVLVLVDYEKKELKDRPDFYILTPTDWKRFVQVEFVKSGKVKNGDVTLDDELVPKYRDGWIGIGLRPEHVLRHKDKWEKVMKLLGT
jgi:hypothetical protein